MAPQHPTPRPATHPTPTPGSWSPARVAAAAAGHGPEASALVAELAPAIRGRIARRLATSGVRARCGDARFHVDDLAQEVWLRLFANGGECLRRWDPERGLTLRGYAALIADRHVLSLLRRKAPQRERAATGPALECPVRPAQQRVEDAELLARIVEGLERRVSRRAMEVFRRLLLEERPVPEVARRLGTSPNALYVASSRLRAQLHEIAAELELAPAPTAVPAADAHVADAA